jgi:hypothetical protein
MGGVESGRMGRLTSLISRIADIDVVVVDVEIGQCTSEIIRIFSPNRGK